MPINSSDDATIASINVTPLVDVALVLVIIFMVTIPTMIEKGLRVNASAQKVVAQGSAGQPLLVEISALGLRVEGKAVARTNLTQVLKRLIAERKMSAVAVSADRILSHGRVVEVLDEVMASGADELKLLESNHGPG